LSFVEKIQAPSADLEIPLKRWRRATCAYSVSALEQEVRRLIVARTVVLPALEVVVEG
jgi:hypothetical protein